MEEKDIRQESENYSFAREGYKSYGKDGYNNKYNRKNERNEGRGGYRSRSYSNREERQQSSYKPNYRSSGNNDSYESRSHYNTSSEGRGYRSQQQRTSYGNSGNGQRSSYLNSRYNRDADQRSFRSRNNYQEGNPYRTQRSYYGNGAYQDGGYNRAQGYSRSRMNGGYNKNKYTTGKKQIEYQDMSSPDELIRLNKFLANAGLCSRREADEFITAGVVSVNGQVVTELGTKVKRSDDVRFHDEPVTIERKVYVLLNKPKDCVTTSDDPQERKTVMDCVKEACRERIYPVGRLDRNTTGVLLLTNDGDLASRLTHPKFLKKKIYHVFCDKNVIKADLEQIANGITLDDGEIHADEISYISDDKSQVGIEIHSGKNRIVRRIFEALGYRVIKLDRVYFAGLTKKGLRRGEWRYLTEQEVNMLRMGAFE